jgi:hypothetical protein
MSNSKVKTYEERLAEPNFYGSAFQILKFVRPNKIINNTMKYNNIKCTDTINKINWKSPIQESNFKELLDGSFYKEIKKIRTDLNIEEMHDFWPKGGPHWDAVGTYTDNNDTEKLLLVEAKSHKAESQSCLSASDAESVRLIYKSLKKCFNKLTRSNNDDFDKYFPIWLCKYYQVANRIAFYEKLTDLGINTTLLFVFFTNDETHIKNVKKFETADDVKDHYNIIIDEMGLEKVINDMDIRYAHVEAQKKS